MAKIWWMLAAILLCCCQLVGAIREAPRKGAERRTRRLQPVAPNDVTGANRVRRVAAPSAEKTGRETEVVCRKFEGRYLEVDSAGSTSELGRFDAYEDGRVFLLVYRYSDAAWPVWYKVYSWPDRRYFEGRLKGGPDALVSASGAVTDLADPEIKAFVEFVHSARAQHVEIVQPPLMPGEHLPEFLEGPVPGLAIVFSEREMPRAASAMPNGYCGALYSIEAVHVVDRSLAGFAEWAGSVAAEKRHVSVKYEGTLRTIGGPSGSTTRQFEGLSDGQVFVLMRRYAGGHNFLGLTYPEGFRFEAFSCPRGLFYVGTLSLDQKEMPDATGKGRHIRSMDLRRFVEFAQSGKPVHINEAGVPLSAGWHHFYGKAVSAVAAGNSGPGHITVFTCLDGRAAESLDRPGIWADVYIVESITEVDRDMDALFERIEKRYAEVQQEIIDWLP